MGCDMLRILSISALAFLLIMSCTPKTVDVCPPFPIPNTTAVKKIRDMHDSNVDSWIVQLYKLKRQLEVCEGK